VEDAGRPASAFASERPRGTFLSAAADRLGSIGVRRDRQGKKMSIFAWRWSRDRVLVVPLALTALPLAGRERESRALRIVSAAGLLAFVVVGAASIGLLFLPSALLMVAAAFTRTRA
jgi:hypothetical protein